MLTIFTIPKPFQGHIDILQRNAIASWTKLHPDIQIILCGFEEGMKEVSQEYNTDWIPNLECTKYGTPLLNSAFYQVSKIARHPILCYVNGDIILMSSLINAVKKITFCPFLMVGQRTNLDITEILDFNQQNWEDQLSSEIVKKGTLQSQNAIDYFIFPRDSELINILPFAVGRGGWDTWFIYRARQLNYPVIDATKAVTIVHQNHDYRHVPKREGNSWSGPETEANIKLMGGWDYVFSTLDATHILTENSLQLALDLKHLQRRWQTLPMFVPQAKPFVRFTNGINNRYTLLRRKLESWQN